MELERLLGKQPTQELLDWGQFVRGKTVMVTGAGGFIASEVCRVIAERKPHKIILVEQSEYALYKIAHELGDLAVPLLASYGSPAALKALRLYRPTFVVHAGAYKHVPLVEQNPAQGIQNNVLEFLPFSRVCQAIDAKLVIVSSDKAVNPTNVMGATKKLVEDIGLITGPRDTRVVRFGNVMWSSGSVLPLFRQQLLDGQEVTLTHKEVDRYFMTVGQAVSLTLQSACLMFNGIYALDMGEPVKVRELISRLAEELQVKSYKVRVTGLRDGEKLHEELTLGQGLEPTAHPQILYAREQAPDVRALMTCVGALGEGCGSLEIGMIRLALQRYLTTYNPSCGIVDPLWLEQNVLRAKNQLEDCFAPTEAA